MSDAFNTERIGRPVTYVDEYGNPHDALVTADWSYGAKEYVGEPSLNLVFVVGDEDKRDSCGRQIERATSVVHQSNQQAHGRYWK